MSDERFIHFVVTIRRERPPEEDEALADAVRFELSLDYGTTNVQVAPLGSGDLAELLRRQQQKIIAGRQQASRS